MLTHQHVQHLTKRNDTLSQKIDKLRARGAKHVGTLVRTGEVITGALLGGVIQGLAKDPKAGVHIKGVPVDFAIGVVLKLGDVVGIAGEEYSHHLGNFGDGFFGAYFSDLGHSIGLRKVASGSFFPAKGAPQQLASAAVHGEVSPQAMAEALLRQMQG